MSLFFPKSNRGGKNKNGETKREEKELWSGHWLLTQTNKRIAIKDETPKERAREKDGEKKKRNGCLFIYLCERWSTDLRGSCTHAVRDTLGIQPAWMANPAGIACLCSTTSNLITRFHQLVPVHVTHVRFLAIFIKASFVCLIEPLKQSSFQLGDMRYTSKDDYTRHNDEALLHRYGCRLL